MLPDPARLVIQVFTQAEEILAAQTDPKLLVGGVEAQQNVLVDYADADFRRAQRLPSRRPAQGKLAVLLQPRSLHHELRQQTLTLTRL
jgi:hypothetical protein